MTQKDVVERLRNITGWPGDHGDVGLCMEAANEIERLRLTDAEREAIEDGIRCCEYIWAYKPSGEAGTRADLFASASALRGLLERTKGTGQ